MNNKPDKPEYLLGTVCALVFATMFMACWLLSGGDIDAIFAIVK